MLILGRDKNDVGDQLEQLTRGILEKLGYRNATVSFKGAGGHEIDVEAEYVVPNPGGDIRYRLICECKAMKDPISIPDWLKFLGKILMERTTGHPEVHGLFIALNGTNGNVAGSFAQLKGRDNKIRILSGDDLAQTLRERFNIELKDSVIAKLRQWTRRSWKHIEEAYNQGSLYWVVRFEDESCTLLSHAGDFPAAEDVARLREPVMAATASGQFVDVAAEAAEMDRLHTACVEILAAAFEGGGASSYPPTVDGYTAPELHKAMDMLSAKDLVVLDGTSTKLRFAGDLTIEGSRAFSRLITFLFGRQLTSGLFRRIAGSSAYQAQIGKPLLELIRERQEGLPVPEAKGALVLDILKFSPSALIYALQPDPIITTHRKAGGDQAKFDANDLSRFLNKLVKGLRHDFESPAFTQFLFENHNLRELDVSQKVVIKNQWQAVQTCEVRERLGVGQMAAEHGGTFLTILLLEEAPDPWSPAPPPQ